LADSSALGMGALAAVVSNSLYLAPSGVLGGATPTVEGEPGEETEETQGLTRSVLKAQVRSLAGARGRSAKLVEALIDANAAARLRRDAETGEADAEDAEVLTLTADEAVKPYLGEPALADGIASSVEELIRKESLKEEVVEIRPGEWERRRQERARGSTAADEAGDVDGVTPRPGGESYAGKILVMEVGQDDLLSKARFEFMERVLDRARMEKAEALILDMNTPGGVAWETSQLILRPFKHQSRQGLRERIIDGGEHIACDRKIIMKRFAHANGLAALARKNISNRHGCALPDLKFMGRRCNQQVLTARPDAGL